MTRLRAGARRLTSLLVLHCLVRYRLAAAVNRLQGGIAMFRRIYASTSQRTPVPPASASTTPVQSRRAPEREPFDPRVQIQQATRLGHHFGRVRISPPAAGATTGEASQAPLARERPSGQHLAPAGRGKSLQEALQGKMERAFGQDFSDVRVHEGGAAESIDAVAFTRGSDIHFAPGRYSPASHSGQKLIGHELAHVVQQKAGQVAVPQGKGAPINADPRLEAEADQLAADAVRPPGERGSAPPVQRRSAEPDPVTAAGDGQRATGKQLRTSGAAAPIQRFWWKRKSAGSVNETNQTSDEDQKLIGELKKNRLFEKLLIDATAAGGIDVVDDGRLTRDASWNQDKREVRLNPQLKDEKRKEALIFELTNAAHTQELKALDEKAHTMTPEEYATNKEQIEWKGIKKHHAIVKEGRKKHGWKVEDRFAGNIEAGWNKHLQAQKTKKQGADVSHWGRYVNKHAKVVNDQRVERETKEKIRNEKERHKTKAKTKVGSAITFQR